MKKRLLAEVVGTFGIVFPPVLWSSHGEGGLLGAALVSGLAVLTMIYAFGPISAAHFNPAVSIGFAASGRFPWRHVPAYIGCQLLGATLAGLVGLLIAGKSSGTHIPSTPEHWAGNLMLEVTISALLMAVIMALATDRRVSSTAPPLGIGLVVTSNVLLAGPITGGSMNPARSLGPALVAGGPALAAAWLYVVGPILGALLGAALYEAARLDASEAKGAPNELLQALNQISLEEGKENLR
jgi:MIP family channel proteins